MTKKDKEKIESIIKELENTIRCNERWPTLEPYYQGVNAEAKLILEMLKE